MKRPIIRREVIGWGIALGIISGIVIDTMIQQSFVVYEAEAHTEIEIPRKEVLIETRINWTPERIEQEIQNTFPEAPNTAVAVAKAESGASLKTDAYNPEWHYDRHGNKVCQGSYGVMQIACVHHIENPEALFDVEFNLQKARQIKDSNGWNQWGGYTSGGWKKYL